MNKYFLNTVVVAFISLLFAGCGGGSSSPAPKTQGSVAVYLFGSMSSASKVAAITSEITVPAGIMINYSSPPGVTTGKHPLRSGSIIPSGTSTFSKGDFNTLYNLDNRTLTIFLVNKNMKDIKSNLIGNGLEIATLNFMLTTPDVLPTLPVPWQDPAVVVWQDTTLQVAPFTETVIKTGLKLNFISSFQ